MGIAICLRAGGTAIFFGEGASQRMREFSLQENFREAGIRLGQSEVGGELTQVAHEIRQAMREIIPALKNVS